VQTVGKDPSLQQDLLVTTLLPCREIVKPAGLGDAGTGTSDMFFKRCV
jgi:hypothetical protein